MKYKDIELELPPLGEMLTTLDTDGDALVGYFYLTNGKREFYSTLRIRLSNDGPGWVGCCSTEPIKWSKLPKFKQLKKEQPPIGIEVLLSGLGKGARNYIKGVNIKDTDLVKRCEDIVIDSWVELETFKEDK